MTLGLTPYESSVTYSYDAGNRLTSVVDSIAGTITPTFDSLDRLTEETTPQGSVSYTYDAANRRASQTVAGQTAVDYTYDNANRLTQITQGTPTVSLAYDDANRRTSLTLPNGVVESYGYDDASQLSGLTYTKSGTTLGNLTYAYDLAGRRNSTGGSLAVVNFPLGVGSATYNADNQLTQWGTANLYYDANGNMTSDGINSYVWNGRNQLASMDSAINTFQYDGYGRRAGKTISGTTTNFLYDGANAVQELSGTTPTANLLTGSTDEYFTRTDSSGTANFLTDALGSTVALTNSSGSTNASYTYEPFGNTTLSSGSSANTYQYTGREDDGTGLYFYRNRYYLPILQRFVSEDPTGFSGGINFYAYAVNDPMSFIDPTGLNITVTAYPGMYGNPAGHISVSINGATAVGFNPAPGWDPVAVLGVVSIDNGIVPGAVLPIAPGRPVDPKCSAGPCTVTIPTTPLQDLAMQNYINGRLANPGFYQLYGRNCARFVYDVLKVGGVNAPDTAFPRTLVDGLQSQY